jgi:ATP-dependent protease ClpP protease subunit
MGSSLLVADYSRRVIWLEGDIEKGFSDKVGRMLKAMNRRNATEPIRFYVQSLGGYLHEVLHAIQLVDASRSPVLWIGFNTVASAALLLIQSGTSAYALKRTKLAFHQARDFVEACPVSKVMRREDYMRRLAGLSRSDALALHQLARRTDIREVQALFEQEACIRPARAIRMGMLRGYHSLEDFKKDRRRMRKLYRLRARRKK